MTGDIDNTFMSKKKKRGGTFTFWLFIITTSISAIGGHITHSHEPKIIHNTAHAQEVIATQKSEEKEYIDICHLDEVICPDEQKELSEDEIIQFIQDTFPEDLETAVNIARCESGLNPQRIGDTTIMTTNEETGEIVGDSIGLFQVRTGGQKWNRAARNGMSADAFRQKMKNPQDNIHYARDIYERRGWSAWYSCAVQLGVL